MELKLGDRVRRTPPYSNLGEGSVSRIDYVDVGVVHDKYVPEVYVKWDQGGTGGPFHPSELELVASAPSSPEVISPREELLLGAVKAVTGDRNNQYGPPTQDFERTAAFWSAAFKDKLKDGVTFDSHEVAVALSLLKISRISWNPEKQDSWMDLAGYAACGWECVTDEAD
jgi:hypothetical protein